MASATNIDAQQVQQGQGSVQILPPTPEKCQAEFELGVALALAFWPALSLAVQNNWGGPASSDKRDWFAGAIVELWAERPDTDLEDVETVLLQVMLDEFEVNVDDDSGFEVAEQIMRFRKNCFEGKFDEVEQLREKWVKKGGKGDVALGGFTRVERGEEEDDTDYSEDDEDEDGDIDMDEAPELVERAPRPPPEIDEDGFQTVVKKGRR